MKELFPGIKFEYCNSQGYWLRCEFAGCECSIHEDGNSALFKKGGQAQRREGPSSLSWLRIQCLASLRADIETSGYVALTKEELDTLTKGRHPHLESLLGPELDEMEKLAASTTARPDEGELRHHVGVASLHIKESHLEHSEVQFRSLRLAALRLLMAVAVGRKNG